MGQSGNEDAHDLVKAFNDCKKRTFNFNNYKRKFLKPDEFLIFHTLNPGLSTKMRKGWRYNLFTEKLEKAFKLITSHDFDKLVNENFEGLIEAKSLFHEAFFLINQKKSTADDDDEKIMRYANVPTERADDIKSAFEKTWSLVEANDVKDLRELQEKRNKFIDKLPLNEDWWKNQIWTGYCEGLIYSCALITKPELDKEKVIRLIEIYTSANASEGYQTDKKTIDSLIRGYAFLIDSLSVKQTIDMKFIKKIHEKSYEGTDEKGGKIYNEYDRLDSLLKWLDLHFHSADFDPVTLAAIAHYGIMFLRPFFNGNHRTGRILQDFILMSFGYPPACIFRQDLMDYRANWELVSSEFEGVDLRSFIRFISENCLSNTLEIFLLKKNDQRELDKIASISDQSATTSETTKQKSGGNVRIDLKKPKSSSSSSEKEISPKRLRMDSTTDLDESLLKDWPPEMRAGSPNKSLQLMPSPVGSLESIQPDSIFSSSSGSNKSQNDNKEQKPLSNQSSLDGNLTAEEIAKSGEDNGTELPPNPWALLFKRALSKYNKELLANTPSNIQEEQEEPAEQIYNGWAEIFKYVLTKFNPQLLHVE